MKRILCITISVLMILSTVIISFAETEEPIKFTVASDIHAKEKDAVIKVNYPENSMYFHAENSGNLYIEAISILDTFFSQSKEQNVDFILLPGDMTNSGTEEQHVNFSSVLKSFEDETGIQVYVVPGNHDCKKTNPDEFKKYYYQFGFDEALSIDTDTASYTVDLPGNYRLIAVDSNKPGEDGDGVNEHLLNWIEEQATKAENDGKTVISMMHHPLLDPIPYAEILMKDFLLKNHEEIAEKYTQWGIPYVFTGHEHGNNTSSFTGKNGKKVYDILTTALTSYPLEYRYIELSSDEMNIKMKSIDTCNFNFISTGYTDEQLELMKSNYTEYAYEYFKYSIEKKIARYITPEFINDKLKQESGPIFDAVNCVMPLVEQSLQLPLYKKDTEGLSVQELAESCSVTLPESDYYNLYDLATTVVSRIYYGAENMPFDSSPEGKVLIVGLNTMLKYILAEAGNEVTALALNSVFGMLNIDKIDKVNIFRWNRALVIGADHSYDVAYSVLEPILGDFLVDDEICDRDASLPSPAETYEVNNFTNFIDEVKAILKYFFDILKTLLFIK